MYDKIIHGHLVMDQNHGPWFSHHNNEWTCSSPHRWHSEWYLWWKIPCSRSWLILWWATNPRIIKHGHQTAQQTPNGALVCAATQQTRTSKLDIYIYLFNIYIYTVIQIWRTIDQHSSIHWLFDRWRRRATWSHSWLSRSDQSVKSPQRFSRDRVDSSRSHSGAMYTTWYWQSGHVHPTSSH